MTEISDFVSRSGSTPLVLVDGSSYLYRAFHAMPPLNNSKGEPTGAVYGVINMLRKLLADVQPEHIAVIFDAKGKTFRNDLYDQYKAHRPPMPDELRDQVEPIHEIVQAMGLPMLQVQGVEADDVIGTLATQAALEGLPVLISTGDKDMAQLVNDKVTLINTMNNVIMDIDGVEQKFGILPEQIIDYLALVGDTSDNIPGIPKVGPKTAVKWLKEYGSVDEIISHADQIKGKVGENLRANLEQLVLSRTLTTIKCDVELEQGPLDLTQKPAERETLKKLFHRMEFKRWLEEVLEDRLSERTGSEAAKSGSNESIVDKSRYETILDKENLGRWIKRLEQAELFAFDTETTSLDYMQAEIVGVSFSVQPGEAAYVPVAHDYPDAPEQLDRDYVLDQLRPLLEDATQAKVGQHLKYDMNVLARYDISLRGIRFDTMLESYVLDSTATRHDMDSLALKYLAKKTIHFEDVAGKGVKQITFNQVTLEQASPYAAEDADITIQLHQELWPKLQAEPGLQKIFDEIEIPLVPVLSQIERNGVLVDTEMLARQSKQLAERMQEIEKECHELAGEEFNLASPKQIQAILFEKLGLPILKKTPKGQPSTAEEVLQELALDYPIPKLLLEHRSMSKLKSTYTDRLPEKIDLDTGRVHTSYHQAVTATGRLSSSDPNLQNIPVRTEEGRRIRQAFIAPEGCQIVAADYSQIELRIMAHLSEDESLLQAFISGEDIHRATAAEVFGVTALEVSNDQRRSAKAINFGLIYGMSAFGLAKQLGITRGDAQNYVDLYFERYPGVKEYMEKTRQQAHDQGYVETVFGRRLYLPEINAKNAMRRQYAERTAINAPMQGTAADIIKRAMLSVSDWIQDSGSDTRMIMQVHDELVFEVSTSTLDDSVENIRRCMNNAASLSVPLIVDVGRGDNWDEAH